MGWQDLAGHELALDRWPPGTAGALQAWDAADLYLLEWYRTQQPAAGSRVLVVDDRWGAVGVALAAGGRPVAAWGDSHLGRKALAANLGTNGLDPGLIPFTPADRAPPPGCDVVLLRLPKDLDCLDDTLRRLRGALAPGARVVAGGMIKHTPTRAWRLLERRIGPAPTTPGRRKARLGVATLAPVDGPRPAPAAAAYELGADGLVLQGAPGVFGGGRLDGGTALLLRHLPVSGDPLAAADVGCGDGVLALALARRCPLATVRGSDESFRAVACARANLERNRAALGADPDRVRFEPADGLDGAAAASLDLVLCNPPFHQGHAVADVTAARMFAQAFAALRPGGRLLVVGNRHLGHAAKLDRIFGGHELLDGDHRFHVLASRRPG